MFSVFPFIPVTLDTKPYEITALSAEYSIMNLQAARFIDGMPGIVLWSSLAVCLGILGGFAAVHFGRRRAAPPLRQAAGSRIALAIGDSFAPSDRFTGFVHEESGASIVLMELPFPAFDRLRKMEDASATFAAQGVSAVRKLELPGRHGEYIYLRGEQKTALVDYAKYILIFRDHGLTGMVTANIPRAALASRLITKSDIETILKSVEVEEDAPQAPKLFTLGYLGPFEEDLSVLGTTKGYRLNGHAMVSHSGSLQPIFLVAPSLTQAPIPNLGFFAERAFNGIDQVRDKAVEAMTHLTVAGLNAVEVLGRGVDIGSGAAALVYQLVVEARHGGYFRLIGLAPESERSSFLSEFRKIGESFQPAEG